MKVLFTPNGVEPFEAELTKCGGYRYNYKFKHADYIGFQFDDSQRPEEYTKEYLPKVSFHGFLMGKKNKPNIETTFRVIPQQ